MKPYISIICPTTRVGGLDLTFEGLQNQTFKDFELIIADALYYKRKDLIKEKSSQYSFPVKHLAQLETAIDMCKAINNAIIRADGTIIYFLPDYTWMKEDCLELHANFHKNKSPQDKYTMLGHFWDCALPKLNKAFYRSYGPKEVFRHEDTEHKFEKEERQNFNNYMDDINSGKLDPLMWSLFEEPITSSNKPTSFDITVKKDILPAGEAKIEQFSHKNESHLLETLLDINGLNEALDGSHGWQDMSMMSRIVATTNTKLYHNPEAITYTFNPREIMYARYRRGVVFRNEKIWKNEIETNFKNPINFYSLREARKYINE